MASQTPWILAADSSPQLLPLLRSDKSVASSQDAHGYSLPHAAASYNHLDLLRALVNEFHVNVNIQDEDGETPLFVVETVEAAQVLVEELKADLTIRNKEGLTAEEKIRSEGDFTTVAEYLGASTTQSLPHDASDAYLEHPPPLPPNIRMRLGSLEDEESLGDIDGIDPEFRRRINELAARDDFQGDEGQKQLRDLITDAVRGTCTSERDVRQRLR